MLIALLQRIEDVVLTGPVLQEILQAFRSDLQFAKVIRFFKPFDILELQRADYIEAAELHRKALAIFDLRVCPCAKFPVRQPQ